MWPHNTDSGGWSDAVSRLSPLQITLVYVAFGMGLLVASDLLLPLVIADTGLLRQVQALKGGIEVFLSGVLIYALVSHTQRELRVKTRAMDEASIGISMTDPSEDDNPLVYVNEGFERITGYSEQEALGRNCRFLQGTATDEDSVAEMAAAVDAEESVTVEVENYRKDGTPFWNEVTIMPLKDIGGTTSRFLGFQRDVTERKRRERELERTEARLERLVEHFPNGGVFLFDEELRYTIVGGADLEELGLSPANLEGRTPADVYPPDLASTLETQYRAALNGDQRSVEVTYEGQQYHVQTVPLRNRDGKIRAGMAVAQNVTERREWIEDIRHREQTYRNLVENAPAPINLFDADGNSVWGNDALLDLLGLDSRDRLVGTPLFEFIHPDDHAVAEEELEGVVEEDAITGPTRFRVVRPDGEERHIQVMTTSGWYEGQRVGQAVANDVTELREAREELRQKEQRYRTLVEMSPDPILVHRDGEVVFANEAFADLVGVNAVDTVRGTDIYDYLEASEHEDARETARRTQRGEQEPTSYLRQMRTVGGDTRQIATTSRPIPYDGQSAVLTIIKDRTERFQYQQALETLHEYTREMYRGDDVEDVSATAVAAVASLQSLPGGVVYRLDEPRNVLEPVASTETLRDGASEPGSVTAETDPAGWTAFTTGETRYVTDRDDPLDRRSPFSNHLYIPIGADGLFVTGATDDEELSELAMELGSILAANLEAAFERVQYETELRTRDRQLERQTAELEELNHLNTITRDIIQSVLDATTRESIEAAVCEKLTSHPAYPAAWVGTLGEDLSRVDTKTIAGKMDGFRAQIEEGGATNPLQALALEAIESESATSVANVLEDGDWADARETALSYGFRSVVAVPVPTGTTTERVLVVHVAEADVVTDRQRDVFAELGRIIGLAMDALGESPPQLADSAVTVDLELPDKRVVLTRIADELDATVTLSGALPVDQGAFVWFVRVDGPPDDAESAMRTVDGVESVEHLAEDDEVRLYRVTVRSTPFMDTLYEYDGRLMSMTAADGSATATVSLDGSVPVREFVDAVRDSYPESRMTARRSDDEFVETPLTFRDSVRQACTDRQYQALQAAHHGGYYEWPRTATNENLAEALGISSPTYQSHRRAAERILVSRLFEPSP
ncbi:PAS domain S-box protein [Halorarius halobius]|uniref:PAS domain S-box protein n=1 Tax=Halorarius halobius TaxID=2962671 RepID=UPI0020CE727B|nr:PAS domain S-box protein [Halorarius halobius]